jgi:hypothetical protein
VGIELGSTPERQDLLENIRDLKMENTNLASGSFGPEIIGEAVNQYSYSIAGPISVYAACFNAAGQILGWAQGVAPPEDLAPGQLASYTVTLFEPSCPIYLVAASGFTSLS